MRGDAAPTRYLSAWFLLDHRDSAQLTYQPVARATAVLACSPIPDPNGMRVSEAPKGTEAQDDEVM